MEKKALTVQARVTPEIFREFAIYDTLFRRKRYLRPILFAVILGAFACACFLLRGRAEQAVFMGAVLLAVGLGLPAVYILSFLRSVHVKAKQIGQKNLPVAYTVRLAPASVTVSDGRQNAEYAWGDIQYACRIRRSICLYVSENRAYLLPASEQAATEEKRWVFIMDHIPAQRRKDLRKQRPE